MSGQETRLGEDWLADVRDRVRAPVNRLLQITRSLLESELQPVQREQVRALLGNGESALEHVDDLLDYLSIEAGLLALQAIDFDLRVMMDGVSRSLALRARDRGVSLATRVHHAVPSRLRGDPGRLRQVIASLVGQAVRRSQGGEVTINVALLDEKDSLATVRFSVVGAPTGADEPPGLGAAIAHHLARLMGGETGAGLADEASAVWFTAVLERLPEVRLDLGFAREVDDQRVLVVCDDPTDREALAGQLETWGCRVETAQDADAAARLLTTAGASEDPFAVAVIDLNIGSAEQEELARLVIQSGVRTRLVLITGTAQRGDAARMEAAGYAAYLTKSVRAAELHTCVAALGSGPPRGLVTRHTLAERRKQALRILLVEHNPVNQELALRVLDRLGYQAHAVATSQEAVERLARTRSDLVLMSVHLPDRNGIATTRLIRDPDSPVLQHDIPIVGLTTRVADATAEDCVAAGMNLCLVRPVEPEVLRQAIERLLKAPTEPEISGGGPRTSALYNRRELLERLDGDETLCRDVVQTFLDGAPPLVEAMYEAALFRDPAQLRRTAHTLADAAANVSAEGIRSLAYRIEHAGRAGELGEVPLLLAELQALLEQLRKLVS